MEMENNAPPEEIVPGILVNIFDVPGVHYPPAEAYNDLRNQFRLFLEDIGHRQAYHYNHPGLNGRYGIELEFVASANRYVIANRVDSCMWAQNDLWWRNNFNALGPILNPLHSDRPLQDTYDFNEWSSFFLEATENHGSSSHKGDERCVNRGNAGPRIEHDGSVEIEPDKEDIQLWSNNADSGHTNTDIRGAGPFIPRFSGLNEPNSGFQYVPFGNFTFHSLIGAGGFGGGYWKNRAGFGLAQNLHFTEGNEFVSNVLTNVHVRYPHLRILDADGHTITGEGHVPLGSLLLDNMIRHMKGHGLVLGVQDNGFHVHISEFPRIEDNAARKQMIIGFVKLFYVFEPLLLSFQPSYRAESGYCQSMQSLLTRDEIRDLPVDSLWNYLLEDIRPAGIGARRLFGDVRYVSLNLKNCLPGGIGTIEVRLGHSTFDSTYIQAYINLLQTLLRFNQALINVAGPDDPFEYHNDLLNFPIIPYYCSQSSEWYNAHPPFPDNKLVLGNQGQPIRGFFKSCGNDDTSRRYKTNIIKALFQLLEGFTGSYTMLRILYDSTIYYHTEDSGWMRNRDLDHFDFLPEMRKIHEFCGHMNPVPGHGGSDEFIGIDGEFNKFYLISAGSNLGQYQIRADVHSILHQCKTCSKNPENVCKADFNDGNYPNYGADRAGAFYRQGSLSDESRVFTKTCLGRTLRSKFQSELINYKTGIIGGHNFIQFGGANTTRKLKRYNNNSIKNTTKMSSYEKAYKTNRGADRLALERQEDGSYIAGDVDWMGNFVKDEKLTQIINALVTRKVVSEKLLLDLEKYRYLGHVIYLTNTELHQRKLKEELAERFGMKSETVEAIKNVYSEFYPKSETLQTIITETPKPGFGKPASGFSGFSVSSKGDSSHVEPTSKTRRSTRRSTKLRRNKTYRKLRKF